MGFSIGFGVSCLIREIEFLCGVIRCLVDDALFLAASSQRLSRGAGRGGRVVWLRAMAGLNGASSDGHGEGNVCFLSVSSMRGVGRVFLLLKKYER